MGLEGLDNRISRLEQRVGQVDDDTTIYVFYVSEDGGPVQDDEPGMIVRVTPQGNIVYDGPPWPEIPPNVKAYCGFDPTQV